MLGKLVFTSLLASAASVAVLAGDVTSPGAEAGRSLYAENCAACHGRYAEGDGPVAGALIVAPPDLTQLAARNGGAFPARTVADYIDGRRAVTAHGNRSMPVWGTEFWLQAGATDGAEDKVQGKIRSLVAFIESLQE